MGNRGVFGRRGCGVLKVLTAVPSTPSAYTITSLSRIRFRSWPTVVRLFVSLPSEITSSAFFWLRPSAAIGSARAMAFIEKYGLLAIIIPSLLPPPMPFKIFVLSAGVFGLPLRRFLITVSIGRCLRYSFWAFMGAVYGHRGLALLQAFDRWFLERAPWFGAAAGVIVLALAVWALRRRFTANGVGEAR